MIIAVDFDGTIVEHTYPSIGEIKLFAFETLKALQNQNYTLILWTYRSGKELQEAVDFCRNNGIEFYAVNSNYPEEIYDENISRKINADVYIDDRNIGGFPGWSKVWQFLENEEQYFTDLENQNKKSNSKKGLFSRLFG